MENKLSSIKTDLVKETAQKIVKIGLLAISMLSLSACDLSVKLSQLPPHVWRVIHWGR